MNILFFIGSLGGGGAERVLTILASHLADRGHNVTISSNKKIVAYEINSKVNVLYAIDETTKTQGRGLIKILRQIRNYIYYFGFVKRTINNVRPDVIISFMHCNMPQILMHKSSIPLISSEHSAMDNKRNSYIGRFFYNRFADAVTVLTPYDKGYATAKGLKKMSVMPNPLTWPVIDLNEYNDTFERRKGVLACGRVDAWRVKGFDLLIKSFGIIAKKYPDWKIDIAGKGTPESIAYLQKVAEENGVGDRINFLGFQSDVRNVMKTHAIFVLSSRIEGLSMALIEAMSVGTPSISYDRLANSIILDSIDGILVADQNVSRLATSMEKLIVDESLRRQIGLNAICNIRRFSSDIIIDKWESLFEELKRSKGE